MELHEFPVFEKKLGHCVTQAGIGAAGDTRTFFKAMTPYLSELL